MLYNIDEGDNTNSAFSQILWNLNILTKYNACSKLFPNNLQ